jgi:hypothetical protein
MIDFSMPLLGGQHERERWHIFARRIIRCERLDASGSPLVMSLWE